MRAGLLREILVFEEPEEEKTPSGFVKKNWKPVFTCKAYKKKQAAVKSDDINAMEEFIENTVTFQTYRYPRITESQRIRWSGKLYRITLVDPQVSDNSYLITCTKIND